MPALTSDEIIEILVDEMTGRERRNLSKEADDLRAKIRPEIEEADRKGYIVNVPSEW